MYYTWVNVKVDVIVVDSVAALTPRAEIEGDMGDSHMRLQARLMSQALRIDLTC
jgi:recombination protein RecA